MPHLTQAERNQRRATRIEHDKEREKQRADLIAAQREARLARKEASAARRESRWAEKNGTAGSMSHDDTCRARSSTWRGRLQPGPSVGTKLKVR